MVSEIFDATRWKQVEGFQFKDITYHRAVDQGTVRIAIDRPEVRNALHLPMNLEIRHALAALGAFAGAKREANGDGGGGQTLPRRAASSFPAAQLNVKTTCCIDSVLSLSPWNWQSSSTPYRI